MRSRSFPVPDPAPSRLLVVDGHPVAPLEIAVDRRARRRGLLGRTGIDGALLLAPASSIHTVAMRFPIDVALCTRDLRVVAVWETSIAAGPGICSRRGERRKSSR